jgi:AcrR family transcriptional regulator
MDAPGGIREQKKRDKEARIRAAALALLRERGFDGMKTDEVARRAGIATGTLFLYVKTKEELLDLVFAGEIGAVADSALTTMPARSDLLGKLLHVFGALLEYYARDLAIARVLVVGALVPGPRSRSAPLTTGFLQRLAAIIEDAQERGQIDRQAYPLELALHAFTLYVGAVLFVINGYGNVSEACLSLRRGLELLFLGLRTGRGKRRLYPRRRKP